MISALEQPRLSGLEEAELYHRHQQDRGFFTLLWDDPDQTARVKAVHAERRQLRRELTSQLAKPLTLFDPPNTQRIEDLRAQLAALPHPSSKMQRSYRVSDLPVVIQALDQDRDTWISQAEFTQPNRRLVHLLRIPLCFVDLDTYKTPFKEASPEAMYKRVWGYCLDEDLPVPSLILFSGRGLQVKWLLERPLPRAALPRWNAVQKHLVTGLELFGADSGAKDASRVLRLVDTINTRSGERVRVLWVNQQGRGIHHYDFESLAEMTLPMARETIREEQQAREERRTPPTLKVIPGRKTSHLRGFSGRQLAWDRLEDLRTLARLRGWIEHGIPHGYRSKYIHWCLNFLALSGAVTANLLYREAEALVREVCPDFTKDVRSVFSTLYRKAQAYEAGETVEFGGKQYPPLYTPRNSTLLELFAVQDAEIPHLKTIIPKTIAAERHAQREQQRRREQGVVDRATYVETAKENAEQRRAHARLLRATGLTWEEVGKEMEISANAAQLLASR